MPPTVVLPTNTPQHEVMRRRDDFKEQKREFKEMLALEKLLLSQLSKAVPAMYLKSFRNQHSNVIDKPVSEILSHLFDTYGKISQEKLRDEEEKLRGQVFEITEPLILMFNQIDRLS